MNISAVKDENRKVILGISGGVDSTTAALLFLKEGFEVYGLYFDINGACGECGAEPENGRKQAEKALFEAYRAFGKEDRAEKHFIYRNVAREFEKTVIEDFCCEYVSGRTPNPCVLCNPTVKFRLLAEAADELGVRFIATGHYADVENGYVKAVKNSKDQSYMLARLPREITGRVIFPLADSSDKDEIRKLAREMGMSNAATKDSQEICFIDDGMTPGEFITGRKGAVSSVEGDYIYKGKAVGKHKGIVNYTVGQRKKLGIALGHPVFVTKIDPVTNTVLLGDDDELYLHNVIIDNLFFNETGSAEIPDFPGDKIFTGKIRYAAQRSSCKIKAGAESGTLTVTFEKAQRAVTPGQTLVIYDENDCVAGCGRIREAF